MISHCRFPSFAIALLLVVGCGGSGADDMSKERLTAMAGGKLKDVTPVSGKVLVDGEGKANVILYLYPAAGGTQINEARTAADGTYCWSSQGSCDGLEAGSYKLAFKLIPKQRRNDNVQKTEDQLKGKYGDPLKSEFKLTVEKGSPKTDANYELTTK